MFPLLLALFSPTYLTPSFVPLGVNYPHSGAINSNGEEAPHISLKLPFPQRDFS